MAQKYSALMEGSVQLRLFRLGWLVVFFLLVSLEVAGIPYRYNDALVTPIIRYGSAGADSALMIAALDDAGISRQGFAVYQTIADSLNVIPFLIFGFLIFWRRPGDYGAQLISLLLILSFHVNSGPLPVFNSISVSRLITLTSSVALILFFYLFPDGRFVPRWTRWAGLLFALLLTPDILFTESRLNVALNRVLYAGPMPLIMFFLLFGSLLYAQVYRYRQVSGPVERLQARWIVAGLVAMMIGVFTMNLLFPLLAPDLAKINGETIRYHLLIKLLILQPLNLLLPVGIGISLLRYRLYDIDVIIHKTLVYTLVTGVLALVYFGTVLLLQSLFARLGAVQDQSPAVVVLSTLAIVALFNPLRRRVQAGVDRRFYRRKYNAEQVLAAFAATARDEVDVERLSAALVAAVEGTVQPEGVSVWLSSMQR